MASACGPWGPQGVFAGGPLAAASAERPAAEACGESTLLAALETRGAWLRHSVTAFCFADGGQRMRIGGVLYDPVATRVDVPAVYTAALPTLARRQFAIPVEGEVRPLCGSPPVETWIWRLDDPAPGRAD